MYITTRDLSSELKNVVDRMVRQLNVFSIDEFPTANELSDFVNHEETYNFTLTCVGTGSLVIKEQCLWNDYCSGVLNETTERFLVTDNMKKEINWETLRLKSIIEEERYLTFKEALMEKSGGLG